MEYCPEFIKKIPSHMDFEGQRKAERIFQVLIVVHGIVGFIVGYVFQQFSLTVFILGFGFALSCLIILPPWPYFRRNNLPWQKPLASSSSPSSKSGTSSTSSAASSKKKNK